MYFELLNLLIDLIYKKKQFSWKTAYKAWYFDNKIMMLWMYINSKWHCTFSELYTSISYTE